MNHDQRQKQTEPHLIPASNLMATIKANVDNKKMTDKEFRQFVRNSLPLVAELKD